MSPQIDEIRQQLERIVGSTALRNSPRLAHFLTFVVEATLAGKGEKIKAYTIAVEALGRSSDFDPDTDASVRVEAGRLRAALVRYYAGAGSNDSVVIDLPRGTYLPTFRKRSFDRSSEPTLPSIETLRSENQRVRDSVVSSVATLLRNTALDPFW